MVLVLAIVLALLGCGTVLAGIHLDRRYRLKSLEMSIASTERRERAEDVGKLADRVEAVEQEQVKATQRIQKLELGGMGR